MVSASPPTAGSPSIIRGAFTAILWLHPLPFDHSIVRTEADAKRWAVRRLQFNGVIVPPELAGGLSERFARIGSVRPPSP